MNDEILDIEETPVFDFENISWVDEKKKSVAFSRLGKAEKEGDVERIAEIFDEIEDYLTKCLVSVPRGWLISSAPAPDAIDWSDKGSFKYIKGLRFQDLLKTLNVSQADNQKK